jgi:uncharacterized protein (TIGR03083 family)
MPDDVPRPDAPARPALGEPVHLAALRAAADALAARAAQAGLTVPVPTCPRWTVADLVAHQGIVHRWAASNLRGDQDPIPSKREVLHVVPPAELLDWFHAGVSELEEAFATADPDVPAMTFLKDPPAPRAFWARRQAHETTIHATDALAAVLGRRPRAEEVAVAADLALDGLDELLTGFVTRGRHALCTAVAPARLAVVPDPAAAGDVGPLAWVLDVRADGIVATRRPPAQAEASGADGVFRGTPAQLYLGLWNRGDEVAEDGGRGLLAAWSGNVKVSWR